MALAAAVKNTYLIDLVVVLRVVLEDLWLLCVLEGMHKFIGTEFLSPFLVRNEPEDFLSILVPFQRCHFHTYMSYDIWTLNFLALRNRRSVRVSNRSV